MKSFLICIVLALSSAVYAQPSLCFEYTHAVSGNQFLNSKTFVNFPFENCSADTVIIEDIRYHGERGDCIYNLPYHRRGDTIPPGQKDTIRFNKRTSYQFDLGDHTSNYIITVAGSKPAYTLSITSTLVENKGRLSAYPINLPKVDRGDTIHFYPAITNYGTDTVTLRYGYTSGFFLNRTDTHGSPFQIAPGEELLLGFEIATQELLAEYRGVLVFETNEEGRYPRFQIEYAGMLNSINHPSIKFDSTVMHKYVEQGGDGRFDFEFINNGEAPLIIEQVKTSRGCLVAGYPREPIAPGERGVIKARYDTKRIGPINKSITVKTNIGSMPVILRVKGLVTKKED